MAERMSCAECRDTVQADHYYCDLIIVERLEQKRQSEYRTYLCIDCAADIMERYRAERDT